MSDDHPASTPHGDRLTYMPQLDGLRAFAVAAVVVHHYLPGGWPQGAFAGVKLFFVLSGFLITGLLVRSRESAAAPGAAGSGTALRQFYARRSLRIFPLYYAVVAAAVIVNLEPARQELAWLLTYTLNIRMASQGWFVDHFAHFWTLSVEEQFYVVWPWVVLFASRRWLIPATLAMIAIGPLYRLWHGIEWLYFGSEATALGLFTHTVACLDALGMGALLALVSRERERRTSIGSFFSKAAMPIGLGGLVAVWMLAALPAGWAFQMVLSDVFLALVFAGLIGHAAAGFGSAAGRVLEFGPVRYLGKISYGIYVYHPFMPTLLAFLFARSGATYHLHTPVGAGLAVLATLTASALSWHFLERPINELRHRIA